MKRNEMLIIAIPVGFLALYYLAKKGKIIPSAGTATTPETARSASLATPISGLLGAGVSMIGGLVGKVADYFSLNPVSAIPTQSTDIGTMFTQADLSSMLAESGLSDYDWGGLAQNF